MNSAATACRFDEVIDRRATNSMKWDGVQTMLAPDEAAADPLPMWVADMDFRAPEPVIAALVEAGARRGLRLSERRHQKLCRGRDRLAAAVRVGCRAGMGCPDLGHHHRDQDDRPGLLEPWRRHPDPAAGLWAFPRRRPAERPLPRQRPPGSDRRWLSLRREGLRGGDPAEHEYFHSEQSAQTRPATSGPRTSCAAWARFCARHAYFLPRNEIHQDLVMNPACRHVPFASLAFVRSSIMPRKRP